MENAMRDYELVFIAAPQLDDEGLVTLNERVTGWITAGNGTVTKVNVWGRQRLAYQIGKHTEGIYVQFDFELAPGASRELERSLRIDEQIIRHLVIRLNED
jgi:small subunit ribosomal protein S6